MTHTLPAHAPAITIWQPWASAMIPTDMLSDPLKKHETRGWPAPSSWIGQPVCIHAAARTCPNNVTVQRSRYGQELVNLLQFHVGATWSQRVPYGAIIGVGVLLKCFKIEGDWQAASDADATLGHWNRGRYAWQLHNVVALPRPILCRGQQRTWYLSALQRQQVQAQLNGGHMT